MVVRDSAVDAQAKGDPVSDIARDTVSLNSNVASGDNVDHERALVVEAPEREATNAHIPHARPGDLAGFGVEVAEDANSHQYAAILRAGRARPGGGFDHGVALTAQLYPVLGDYHVLSVNSPHDDSVARIGSVYGLLDGLARPNDLVCRLRRADRRRQSHPAGHQHGQSHGGQQHYGASHKQSRLPSGGGVSVVVRRYSRRPFISNRRSIMPYRGRCITQMDYLCGYLGVACG